MTLGASWTDRTPDPSALRPILPLARQFPPRMTLFGPNVTLFGPRVTLFGRHVTPGVTLPVTLRVENRRMTQVIR
jgi:hypothetical protein